MVGKAQAIPEATRQHRSRTTSKFVRCGKQLCRGGLLDALEDEEYRVQNMLANPLAYAASRDPDTMYVDQALKAPDKKEFLKAMQKEVEAHTEKKQW